MFLDVRVQPNFGAKQILILWHLPPHALGEVFIYRSITGTGGWDLLNQTAPVPSQNGAYVDTEYRQASFNETPHYRLLFVDLQKNKHPSPPIGILEDLTPLEKAGVARMILNEHRIQRATGVKIFFYFPLYSGVPCASVDPQTGQKRGFDSCPDTNVTTDCYGQPFVGGFQRPVQTRMILEDTGSIITAHDGSRKISGPSNRVVRLMAFPRPRHDCLIVQPKTDDRYVIGEGVEPFNFKGVYPIAFNAPITLLPRSDPRYRVPVPPLAPD